MSRSSKKGPYVDPRLLKKIMRQKQSGDKGAIKTWARDSVISPDFVGHTLAIHNGKSFEEVFISESMVGHKVGEFAHTRTFRGHGRIVKRTMTKT
jgi:small subunit ribosomal protein S19